MNLVISFFVIFFVHCLFMMSFQIFYLIKIIPFDFIPFIMGFLFLLCGIVLYLINKVLLHIKVWQFILLLIINLAMLFLSFLGLIGPTQIPININFILYFWLFIFNVFDDPMGLLLLGFTIIPLIIITPVSFFITHLLVSKILKK